MKRNIVKDCVLYESSPNWDYGDYVDFCKDMDFPIYPENSAEYYGFLNNEAMNDWEDFKSNMEYGDNNQPCMIIGSLGLWTGKHDIAPFKEETLMGAINRCLSGDYDKEFEIILTNGHIEVNVHHHDGTNCFEIWTLSEKGKREVERPKYTWNGENYKVKRDWFKLINGYLF